jgi:hypothetical protein
VSADLEPGQIVQEYRARRASARLSGVTGTASLVTGVLLVVLAVELRISGADWLPWIVLALAPAIAGGLCLSRNQRAMHGPAAVFGSCTAVVGVTVPVGLGRDGAVTAVIALLAVAGGIGAVTAAIVLRTAHARSPIDAVRLPPWTAVAALVIIVSIPSPAYFPPDRIGTIFTGNTGSQNVVVAIGLLLVALPLVVAGLVRPATSAAIAAGWLPAAVAQLIAGPIIQTAPARLDIWYYLSWLPWVAVAALAATAAGLFKPDAVR